MDRSRQLAVNGIIMQIRQVITERVRKAHSEGSANSSWHSIEEFQKSEDWHGAKWTDVDAKRRDQVLASYDSEAKSLATLEEELFKALADLLKG